MKALITGATGFIGANLVEAVSQRGWQARALHRRTSSLKALQGLTYESALGDITEPDSLLPAMRDVDVVFHAAAVADYWRAGRQRLYQVNVDGTRNVLRAARQVSRERGQPVRVVFVSSVAALGRPPFGQPLNESAPFNLRPEQFHYGYSKVLAESHVRASVADGLDAVIVNPAVVIGPRDVNFISGSIIIQAARRRIPFYPPGGVCVIDVADVCAGCIAAAERGRAGERYILGGENLWHRDMLGVVCDVAGRPRPRLTIPGFALRALAGVIDLARAAGLQLPFNGEQARFAADTFWFDSTRARRELGLTTRPFIASAQRTYAWYRQNGYLGGGMRGEG